MYNEIVIKINSLFSEDYSEHRAIDELNSLFTKIELNEQLQMHSDLSFSALKGLYNLIDKVDLNSNVKEHIIWFYNKKLIDWESNQVDEKLFSIVLEDYKKYRLIALESIFVDLLKRRILTLNQVEIIGQIIESKEIKKQVCAFKTKYDVDNGALLSNSQVTCLLELKAYDALNYALDRDSLAKDALNEFVMPEKTENNRKIKEELFNKAQKLKCQKI